MTHATLQIHASCLSFKDKGVLLVGESGAGKSETALRLLDYQDFSLVADDRVNLISDQIGLLASCPLPIQGLLEVRGIGILKTPFKPSAYVHLAVFLAPTDHIINRSPPPSHQIFLDHPVPFLTLCAHDVATPAKIRAALLYPLMTDLL